MLNHLSCILYLQRYLCLFLVCSSYIPRLSSSKHSNTILGHRTRGLDLQRLQSPSLLTLRHHRPHHLSRSKARSHLSSKWTHYRTRRFQPPPPYLEQLLKADTTRLYWLLYRHHRWVQALASHPSRTRNLVNTKHKQHYRPYICYPFLVRGLSKM